MKILWFCIALQPWFHEKMRKFTKHRNSWKCIQWIFVQSRIIKSGLLFLNFKTISRKFIKMKKNKVSRISILTFLIIKNYPSSGQKIRQNERSYVYVNWMSTTFHEFFAKVYEKNCTDKKIRIKNRENRGKNVNLNLCIFEFKFRLELTRKIKNWKKNRQNVTDEFLTRSNWGILKAF